MIDRVPDFFLGWGRQNKDPVDVESGDRAIVATGLSYFLLGDIVESEKNEHIS